MDPVTSTPTVLWERLPEEKGKAYAAFCCYRDMPRDERTMLRVVQLTTGKHPANLPGYFIKWSQDHRWTERAQAYDDHLDRIELAAREERARADAGKWMDRLQAFREQAFRQLAALANNIEDLAQRPIAQVGTITTEPTGRPLTADKTTGDGKAEGPKAKRGMRKEMVLRDVAIDLKRAVAAQTELAQLCFGPLLPQNETGSTGGVSDTSSALTSGSVTLAPTPTMATSN